MSQPSTSDPRRVESDFRRHLRWAVVWPLAAFFLASGVLVALVLHVQHRNKRVDQTDVVIGRATLVERLIVDRESRLRAYMVTGDRRFSESYREADERLAPAITNLEELVSEHPAQVARLVSMQAALARWQEYAEQQLARRLDAATAQDVPFHVLDGEAIASDIRSRLHEFIEVEEARRVRRGIRAEAVTHYAFLLGLVFALLLGPALALTTAYQMGRSRQKYREALEAQERTARTLRESEEKLRLAEDAAKMGSLHRDFLSGETVWSDSFKALFDLSPDAEMSYEVFLAAVHPDDRDRVDRAVQDALANRTPYQVEMRVPWPDGSVRWVASRGEAFYDDHGRPVRMAGMALDVTAQKRAEEAVRESDRRKDEFLGMLSHELRNPLASIHNSVHLLGHAAPASEQAARARTVIERQVDHLARLVDDLLDVKRISTGKLRLRTAVMDLTQQVRETVEDIRPLFVSRSLSLDMKAPDQAVRVDGDRTRLTQMVSNLLHNAAKFTDAGGHVSVTVESRGGQARIRVLDDGVGVAPEMLDKLFDPFVQSDRTLHRTTGGLGLGLSLVRGIAELHGGTVIARSGGSGKGTEFEVTLPTTQPGVAPADETVSPETTGKSRVLIIEDNVDAAVSLRDLIQMLGGHEVHVAHDGEAGIAAAREQQPHVILCDIGLPVMGGYEVARRIRFGGVAPGARLIALTGYASPEDIDRALRAGFDYHIAKPPDIDRVLALVAEASSRLAPLAVPDDLATGHHEVDAQHASLLSELARLRTASPETVWESLRLLQQHTSSHLRYEETLMDDVGYPDLAAHKQRHEDYLRRSRVLQEQLERDGVTPDKLSVLADSIQAWVTEHVYDEDRRLTEFIRERKPSRGTTG